MPDLADWHTLIEHIDTSKDIITIGMIGKYIELEDAYYSVNEAIKIAGFSRNKKVKLTFVESEEIEQKGMEILQGLDGICIPGGFGNR